MTTPPDRQRSPDGMPLGIAPFAPYLIQRWNAGCRNANQLWRELVAQGFRQSARTVARYMTALRHEAGIPRKFTSVAPNTIYDPATPLPTVLTTRAAVRLLQRCPRKLTAQD